MGESILINQIAKKYKKDFSPLHFNSLLNDFNSPFSNNAIFCLYEIDDITYPHFHLMDIGLDSPICLYKSKYFFHDNSNNTINDTQLKYLWKILNTNISYYIHTTFWKHMCLEWDNYHNTNFSSNKEMPNYIGGIKI